MSVVKVFVKPVLMIPNNQQIVWNSAPKICPCTSETTKYLLVLKKIYILQAMPK